MKKSISALSLLLISVQLAHAGLLDFIGDIGSSVAEASWKIVAVKAIEGSLTTIITGIAVIGLLGCVVAVYTVASKFADMARAAMRDNEITPAERWVLSAGGLLLVCGLVVVGWLAWFLITIAGAML